MGEGWSQIRISLMHIQGVGSAGYGKEVVNGRDSRGRLIEEGEFIRFLRRIGQVDIRGESAEGNFRYLDFTLLGIGQSGPLGAGDEAGGEADFFIDISQTRRYGEHVELVQAVRTDGIQP